MAPHQPGSQAGDRDGDMVGVSQCPSSDPGSKKAELHLCEAPQWSCSQNHLFSQLLVLSKCVCFFILKLHLVTLPGNMYKSEQLQPGSSASLLF